MSIKNQKPLFISAAVIILLTAVGLISLNYAVEKISKLKPPKLAVMPPPPPPRMPGQNGGTDDIQRKRPPTDRPPVDERAFPPGYKPDDMAPPQGMRRIRNGKDAPDIRRMPAQPPQPPQPDPNQQRQQQVAPPQNGGMMQPPPMQPGMNLDQQQRELLEQELQRRREMYPSEGYPMEPPPGYYPPPGYGPPDGYEGGYPEDYDYYDYYEDDPDYQGKREDRGDKKNVKLTDHEDEFVDEDGEDDPDSFPDDDYLNDHEE